MLALMNPEAEALGGRRFPSLHGRSSRPTCRRDGLAHFRPGSRTAPDDVDVAADLNATPRQSIGRCWMASVPVAIRTLAELGATVTSTGLPTYLVDIEAALRVGFDVPKR